MRIGITGATGFIGGAVANLAQANGHEVVAYTRSTGCSVAHAAATLVQPAHAPHALPETRLDALIHLAGESLMGWWSRAKLDRIRKSRVEFTRDLVAHLGSWQPANRPRVLIGASGIGFYGDRGDEVLTEASPRGTGFLAELCEQWEGAAREAEALGMRVVSLRTALVLGKEGGAYPLLRRLFRTGLGGKLGSGCQWTSWIHIADEAALILWAAGNGTVSGPMNLCAPQPVTNAGFTRALAASLHRPAFMPVPAFMLRLLLGRMADEMLLASQRALPAAAAGLGYRHTHPEVQDALRALAERSPA